MKPLNFIQWVWREQGEGYGFISLKTDTWTDFAFKQPGAIRLPTNLGDLYFTPNLFSKPHRRKELMLPSRWLYADLDAVDPNGITSPRPTVAWESSPGRFQCMWLITRALDPQDHGELNQKMTYHFGADKGGWDATQVLRIPGTRNYKYDEHPEVKLLWR